MKKIKAIMAVLLLTVSTSTFAQFSNNRNTAMTSTDNDGWNTFYAEWSPSSIYETTDDGLSYSFNGFSLGYSRALSISNSLPFFVEAGIGLQYSCFSPSYNDLDLDYDISDTDINFDCDFNWFSAKVPVELLYAWQMPNNSITLIPHAGINLRFNIAGKAKYSLQSEDYGINEKEESDLFGKDSTWKRFQIGWQIGLKARFNQSFILGVSYGSDFTKLAEQTKTKGASITLGYTF